MKNQLDKRFSFKDIENELVEQWTKKIFLNLKISKIKNLFVL